jgi:hypothetical protein
MSHIVHKVCPCCKAALTRPQWEQLPLMGEQDTGVLLLELRNCRCGSTIAVRKGLSPQLQETTTRIWLDACLAQLHAERTRRPEAWADAGQKWRLAADVADTVGHQLDAVVFSRLADEAAIASDIADAVDEMMGSRWRRKTA